MPIINTAPQAQIASPDRISGRITCRVCDAKVTVPLDHPALLCPLCLENPETTHDRVQSWLSSTLSRLDQVQAEFQELVDFSPARDRWQAVAVALVRVGDKELERATLARTWAKRKAEGGPLAELLVAYERYCTETDRLSAELERLGRAQTELNAVWMATEV